MPIVSRNSLVRSKALILVACSAGAIFAACGPQPLTDFDFPDAGGSSGSSAIIAGHPGAGSPAAPGGSGGTKSTGGSGGTTGGTGATGGSAATGGGGGSMNAAGSAGAGFGTGGVSGTSSTFGGAGRGGSFGTGGNAGTGSGTGGAKPFGGGAGTGMTLGGAGRGGSGGIGGKGAGGMTGSGGASAFTAVAAIVQTQCGSSSCHGGRQNPKLTNSNLSTLYSTLTGTGVSQCGNDHLVTKSDAANSALLELEQHQCGTFIMPRGCTQNPCFSAADTATITNWIAAGAPGP